MRALHCVDHERLWCVLSQMGVPTHLIVLLKNLYSEQIASVRTECGESAEFPIKKGVRQGCVISPILYNIYAEMIIRNVLETWSGGVRIGGRMVSNLRYADDTTILASSKEELRIGLIKLKTESEKAGLFLNLNKTKVMTTANLDSFVVDGEPVEVVHDYVFLGAKIADDARDNQEVLRRIAMGKKAIMSLAKIWRDRGISLATKVKLVETLVFPITLYGAESWTLRKRDRKKIDSFELWCWRRILRIPWTARRSNISVLSEVKPSRPLQAVILEASLRFFGHVARRPTSLERDIMLGRMEGQRRRGRPRITWLDGIREAMGQTVSRMVRRAEDRARWRMDAMNIARGRYRLDGTR